MTVPKRFSVLRLLGTLFKVMAWIVLVLSVLAALAIGLAEPLLRQSILEAGVQSALLVLGRAGGIVAGLLTITVGVVSFLALFATGESIHLQLAIEENTRMAAALLLKLDEERESAVEATPYTYYGEVVRE